MNQSFRWSPEVYLSIIPFTTGGPYQTLRVEFIFEYAQCNLTSHHHPTTSPSLMVLLKLGLCLLVPNRNAETDFGVKQKGVASENSLVVQWLILHASSGEGVSLIPGQGLRILHTMGHSFFFFFKVAFITLPGKGGHRSQCPLDYVLPIRGESKKSKVFTDQCMISSWTILRLVGIKVKF